MRGNLCWSVLDNVIYTCGHSTRSFNELIHLLHPYGITTLVDVRAIPRSRYYSWFNKAYLQKNLPMKYVWMGERLGGKNAKDIPPELFAEGIEELIELSQKKNEVVCIMCSERDPGPTQWRKDGCHRWNTIAPALEKRGIQVEHL